MIDTETERLIAQFSQERDAVLRSLDPERIAAFHAKHNPSRPPMRGGVVMAAAHKARVQAATLTEDERQFYRAWLIEHGYSVPP